MPSILQKVVEVGTKSDARLMSNLCVIITVYAVQGSQSTHTRTPAQTVPRDSRVVLFLFF